MDILTTMVELVRVRNSINLLVILRIRKSKERTSMCFAEFQNTICFTL